MRKSLPFGKIQEKEYAVYTWGSAMNPQEQEKLFEKVRKHFPAWNFAHAGGYVHGVTDGLRCSDPQQNYIDRFKGNDCYAVGYICGFVDAYGEDVLTTDWYQNELMLPDILPDYRWWENVE